MPQFPFGSQDLLYRGPVKPLREQQQTLLWRPDVDPATIELLGANNARPQQADTNAAVSGLQRATTAHQAPSPNLTGPYQSREEMYRQAYAQPQRATTMRMNPSVDGPLGFEETETIQPGWQQKAAMNELSQLLGTERENESFERERIQGIRGQQDEALTQGFDRPVDRALYERRIAEEKMRQPIELQRMIGQTQRDVTDAQGQNSLNVARLQDEGYTSRAKSAEEFQKWLRQNNPSGMPISGYTAPGRYGGGGMRFDTDPQAAAQVPAGLKRGVAEAWASYLQNPSFENEGLYKIMAGQALEQMLTSGSINSSVMEVVREVIQDESLRNLSFEELTQHLAAYDVENPDAEDVLNPNDPADAAELEQLRRALLVVKGL